MPMAGCLRTCGKCATRRCVVFWSALRVSDSMFERRTALERVRAAVFGGTTERKRKRERERERERKRSRGRREYMVLLVRIVMSWKRKQ